MPRPISKYSRVQKKPEPAADNEIRVKLNNPPHVYTAYVARLLLIEKKHNEIFLKATGAATSNAIKITEHLRSRIQNLHAAFTIESTNFTDEYEPLEEGLVRVTDKRTVSSLKIRIRLGDAGDLTKEKGYMAPQTVDAATQEQFLKKIEETAQRREDRKKKREERGDADEDEEPRERRTGGGRGRGDTRRRPRGGESRRPAGRRDRDDYEPVEGGRRRDRSEDKDRKVDYDRGTSRRQDDNRSRRGDDDREGRRRDDNRDRRRDDDRGDRGRRGGDGYETRSRRGDQTETRRDGGRPDDRRRDERRDRDGGDRDDRRQDNYNRRDGGRTEGARPDDRRRDEKPYQRTDNRDYGRDRDQGRDQKPTGGRPQGGYSGRNDRRDEDSKLILHLPEGEDKQVAVAVEEVSKQAFNT